MRPAEVSSPFAHFLDALSFLSRLGPARSLRGGLSACLPWFAAVGLTLGSVCSLVAWLFSVSLAAKVTDSAWAVAIMAGWSWLCCMLWLTRALHWDGLADLADAVGSAADGPRFWEILRDSRLGAFGALALLCVFSGQWICLSWHIWNGQWVILLLAPAWGRACAIWLAAAAPPYEAHSLGGQTSQGAKGIAYRQGMAAILLTLVFPCFGLPWLQAILLPIGQYVLIRRLAQIAQKQGGFSGDFLGASIESGQLWFLLALL